jgi:hypothetical protein
MKSRQPSLKRRLIIQPFLLQTLLLLIAIGVLTALMLRLDIGGAFSDETLPGVVAKAVVRRGDGGLAWRPTP